MGKMPDRAFDVALLPVLGVLGSEAMRCWSRRAACLAPTLAPLHLQSIAWIDMLASSCLGDVPDGWTLLGVRSSA